MNELYHYGVGHDENPPGRGSGRYPYGSENNTDKSKRSKHDDKWERLLTGLEDHRVTNAYRAERIRAALNRGSKFNVKGRTKALKQLDAENEIIEKWIQSASDQLKESGYKVEESSYKGLAYTPAEKIGILPTAIVELAVLQGISSAVSSIKASSPIKDFRLFEVTRPADVKRIKQLIFEVSNEYKEAGFDINRVRDLLMY